MYLPRVDMSWSAICDCDISSSYMYSLAFQTRIQRGDRGSGTPLKNHKNIGFLINTGPDPLKATKLQSQYSMLGQHRHASETPFIWRFAGGPMMARLQWYLDPSSPHQLKTKSSKPLWQNFLGPRNEA